MLPELFSNYFKTSLSAGCTSSDGQIEVNAPAPTNLQSSGQFRIIVDPDGIPELMIVTAGPATQTWTVTRGVENTTPVAHNPGVDVVHIITAGVLGGQSDAASGVPSLRSLGTGAGQAAAGALIGAASGLGTLDSSGRQPIGQFPLVGVSVSSNPTGAGLIPVSTGTNGQVGSWLGTTTLAANATTNFMGVPTIAGTPTGVPTTVAAETRIAYDATSHQIWTYDGSVWAGIGSSYSVLAPKPSGNATTDTTNILAAIAATPAGGTLQLHLGKYLLNSSPTVSSSITIRGKGAGEVWSTVVNSNGTQVPGAAPWVQGTVLEMQTAATNGLTLSGTGMTAHLRDFVISFASSIAFNNTGHGIFAVPGAYLTGFDNGITTSRWDNLIVFGHDGNHYAYYQVNANLGTYTHLRSYGGGHWYIEANTAYNTAYGNHSITSTYGAVFAGGSADGFHQKSGATAFPGDLNLLTYTRPQANIFVATGAIASAFTITPPTNAQQMWNDVGQPNTILLIAADLEAPNNTYTCTFGVDTQVIQGGSAILGGATTNTSYGSQALNPFVTGGGNTAFGFRALTAVSTGIHDTAVGTGAGASLTSGAGNTAVGTNALNAAASTSNNTSIGYSTLLLEAGGSSNTLVGSLAGASQNGASNNTGVGFNALNAATAGSLVAVGSGALATNTTGTGNTAVGTSALNLNLSGLNNTAVGLQALTANTASSNTAVGASSMKLTTSGANNVAVGFNTLAALLTNGGNVAVGSQALLVCTAANNTGVGSGALVSNTTGTANVAIGQGSMNANVTGGNNVAVGNSALLASTTGLNAAIGSNALAGQTSGSLNVAMGYRAGYAPAGTVANATVTGASNTFIGYQTGVNSTGDYSGCTALGAQALVNGANATALGAGALAGAGGAVAIGVDHSGGVATTTTQDAFILGTANHLVTFANVGTGAGSAALGANSPAVTNTAPFTWVKLNVNVSGTLSTVYMPVWK